MSYNNETRKLYPTYVGFIKTKDWPDMICDPDLCETIVTTLNTKWLVRSELYQRTIHAFNVEYIEKVKVKDEHRKLVDQLVNRTNELSEKTALSFNQSLQWLKSNHLESLPMNK